MFHRCGDRQIVSGARLVALMSLLAVPCAHAEELIFPGIQPKAGAGAGQTVSRGGVAVFYNPANMIFSKFIEPFVDVSFAKVTYTYTHTDTERFQPVTVPVTTPAVTVGASFRPLQSLAFGVGFFPTSAGKEQSILNVPTPVGTSYSALDVVQKASGYKLGAGAAFRPAYPFSIGLGWLRTTEQTQVLSYSPLAAGADTSAKRIPLIDAVYGGDFNQFIGGVRSELFERTIALGLSYKTAVTKTYAAGSTICLATACGSADKEAEYSTFEGVGYAPAVLGLGLEGRWGAFGGFVDVVHEFWAAGRTLYKRGLGPDPTGGVDFVDTNNFCVGGKFWLAPKHMITAAYGRHDANVGFGTVTTPTTTLKARGDDVARSGAGIALTDDASAEPVVGGVTFGALEAIPRNIFAGGYRMKLTGSGYFQATLQYTTGSLSVPEGASGEGLYTLNVILASLGLAYGF